MISPQRCGTVDNPHIFVGKDIRRCQLCNKHIRDVHIADHIIDNGREQIDRMKELGYSYSTAFDGVFIKLEAIEAK